MQSMRLVPVETINENMILGKTLYTSNDQVLLVEGVRLKSSYKQKLRKFGIREVYDISEEKNQTCSKKYISK